MDKVLLKIAGIIVIIIGICYCFLIIGAIVGIPLIIGGSRFMNYSNMTDDELVNEKNNLLYWSIFFLFFTIIGGVIGLMFYFQLNGALDNLNNIMSNQTNKKSDYITEIERLKKLYEEGTITKKEYEDKKKQLLDL